MFETKAGHLGVLFVCANNICRSPMAEGAFRAKAMRARLLHALDIASAGTHSSHAGQVVDPRARLIAERRGYAIPRRKARQVTERDFERFRWILAMDRHNLAALNSMRPTGFAGHLGLYCDLVPQTEVHEIPDPYFGALAGFDYVFDLLEAPGDALVQVLERALATR